ncbi:MAG: hypothetical protein WDO24_13830 [Pseudomonadota bacterium]
MRSRPRGAGRSIPPTWCGSARSPPTASPVPSPAPCSRPQPPGTMSAIASATAGSCTFIRQFFPVYYLVMAGCTALAALLALPITSADALVLAAVSAGFLYAWLGLLPRVDQARERASAGDTQATARFRRLHRASTVLNALQLVAVASALIRLVS